MEKMYQDYNDIAEFRIVYISEAHAADGDWPFPFAEEKGITEHKTFHERCSVADMMMVDEKLSIPCIVDGLDNHVNTKYSAWPDRVFLIRKDGVIAVAAKRGPWGYKPAIDEAANWLAEYRATGEEPKLTAR